MKTWQKVTLGVVLGAVVPGGVLAILLWRWLKVYEKGSGY